MVTSWTQQGSGCHFCVIALLPGRVPLTDRRGLNSISYFEMGTFPLIGKFSSCHRENHG